MGNVMITLFCKRDTNDMFNGKPLYHGFPRPVNGKHDSAKKWQSYRKPHEIKDFTVDNTFTGYIVDDVSVRCRSVKIPQIALYLKDHDVYVRVDFRLDGLIHILCNHTVSNSKINVDVGIRFSGSNYYVDEISKILQTHSTKGKKTPKLKPVVGEFYNINPNIAPLQHQYLGQFIATKGTEIEPYGDISGKKYHVFVMDNGQHAVIDCFRSIPVNIRQQHNGSGKDFTTYSKISTPKGSLGMYGFDNDIEIDIQNETISFTNNHSTNNNQYRGCDSSSFTYAMKTILGK